VVREIPKTASEKPQDRFLIEALGSPEAEIYRWRDGEAVRAPPIRPANAAATAKTPVTVGG
jgi:hypothetical protein